jgi:hypothetical protein
MNRPFGSSLGDVRSLLLVTSLAWLASLAGCRILQSGLSGDAGPTATGDTLAAAIDRPAAQGDAQAAIDLGEPPGVQGASDIVGCSDGGREGFRDVTNWPSIAGCAGAFDQPGVIGSPDLAPMCDWLAGDSNTNRDGIGCTAADLCAANWHVCRNGDDVAKHSPSGGCEGCVPAGETRFFLVASGASPMGICSPDPGEVNDLHGCGGFGRPEVQGCAPLARRMGFADCLATKGVDTKGVWNCGGPEDSLREAMVVTKTGTTLGGVLCCKD